MSTPTLLMIRPLRQAHDFVAALSDQMGRAPATVYAPILEIEPIQADPIPDTTQYLLFSSVNGVRFFADQTDQRDIPTLCVGDTTTAAAQAAGFTATSAGGTAQDLIALAKSSTKAGDGPLVYVSGAEVAHAIDQDLSAAGRKTLRRIVYAQTPKPLTDVALDSLKTNTIVPISSPNTARMFASQTADLDLSNLTCVSLSDNVAAPLAPINATKVTARHPTRNAMIDAISELL